MLLVATLFLTAFLPATVPASDSGGAPKREMPVRSVDRLAQASEGGVALPRFDDNVEAMVDTPAPDLTAASVLAVDLTSGDLLYQRDADQQRAPASTLKIVTALTALEVLEPDQEIEIQAEDLVDVEIYSNAALQAGDVVTVESLLAGALIPSGGDAAKALARVAGERLGVNAGTDPTTRFVEEMNAVANDLGMRSTNFANPDGADHPNQYTTARDLAIAGAALLNNGLLADQVAQTVYEMTITGPNARTYELFNTNDFLGIERVHGIKTGTTGEAGENVVLATKRTGNQILTVVLGSESRYEDTQALLEHIDNQVTWIEFGANSDFPGIQTAAERYNFVLATPVVRPVLNGHVDWLYTRLWLGPRPESLVPISWGYVVFLHDGDELYRVPVLTTVS